MAADCISLLWTYLCLQAFSICTHGIISRNISSRQLLTLEAQVKDICKQDDLCCFFQI